MDERISRKEQMLVVVKTNGLHMVTDEHQPPPAPQAIPQTFAAPLPPSHPAEETEQGKGVVIHEGPPPPKPPPPPSPPRRAREKGRAAEGGNIRMRRTPATAAGAACGNIDAG